LACRTKAKGEAARKEILDQVETMKKGGLPAGEVVAMECDLASLKSIRQFAADWKALGKSLDVLVCNAGLSLSTAAKPPPPTTADGFEITVGTNHLGHFLLCNLLLPELERSPDPHPRIVITASQVHDPESAGGNVGSKATLGNMDGLAKGSGWEMVDGGAFDGDKAYKDSKLCNVLFTREMQRRLSDRGSKVTCNSFSPGLITRSGLFRDQNPIFVGLFDFIVYNVAHVAETVDFGGGCLVTMAVGPQLEGKGAEFWSNSKPGQHTFEKVEVSKEAQDAAKARRLWELSARAVGLTPSETIVLNAAARAHEAFT